MQRIKEIFGIGRRQTEKADQVDTDQKNESPSRSPIELADVLAGMEVDQAIEASRVLLEVQAAFKVFRNQISSFFDGIDHFRDLEGYNDGKVDLNTVAVGLGGLELSRLWTGVSKLRERITQYCEQITGGDHELSDTLVEEMQSLEGILAQLQEMVDDKENIFAAENDRYFYNLNDSRVGVERAIGHHKLNLYREVYPPEERRKAAMAQLMKTEFNITISKTVYDQERLGETMILAQEIDDFVTGLLENISGDQLKAVSEMFLLRPDIMSDMQAMVTVLKEEQKPEQSGNGTKRKKGSPRIEPHTLIRRTAQSGIILPIREIKAVLGSLDGRVDSEFKDEFSRKLDRYQDLLKKMNLTEDKVIALSSPLTELSRLVSEFYTQLADFDIQIQEESLSPQIIRMIDVAQRYPMETSDEEEAAMEGFFADLAQKAAEKAAADKVAQEAMDQATEPEPDATEEEDDEDPVEEVVWAFSLLR